MTKTRKTETLSSTRVTPEMLTEYRNLLELLGKTHSELVRECLEEYLKDGNGIHGDPTMTESIGAVNVDETLRAMVEDYADARNLSISDVIRAAVDRKIKQNAL